MTEPNVNFSIGGKAVVTIGGRRDLIIGTLPSSSDYAGTLIEKVNLKTETELNTIFGASSDLRNKVKKYLDTNKRYSELDVLALEENAYAVNAYGSVDLSGVATADGTLVVAVVDEKQFYASISVSEGDTASEVATKISNAFQDTVFTNIPVIASVDGDSAKFTARDAGTLGNYYGIKVTGTVAGLTVALTAFAHGAEVPSFTSDNFPTKRYFGTANLGYTSKT